MLTPGAERFVRAVTEFVFVEDVPQRADVILIPGSRTVEHALKAAEMYRAGYAPYVLPSGRYAIAKGGFLPLKEPLRSEYPDAYESEWHFLKTVLMRHGVPEEAILREERATYTWENARFSHDVLVREGIGVRTAMLCCHAFHARRALLYYQAAMPGVRFIVCPAQTPGYGRDDWFLTEKGRTRILGEVQRLGSQISEVFAMMMEDDPGADR